MERFHRPDFLSTDPLEFVHEERTPEDQEAIGLLASQLAYGNVRQIRASVAEARTRMRAGWGSPAAFTRSLARPAGRARALRAFATFRHRFQTGGDLVALFSALGATWSREGSLGAAIRARHRPGEDMGPPLARLLQEWKRDLRPRRAALRHLLASPADGSVCKRWAMYFRWMVRKDAIDLGTWAKGSALLEGGAAALPPSALILPLDTHTGRIAGDLGLTGKKTLNWNTARAITEKLRGCDPEDPVKYDFALCRLGILGLRRKGG